MYQQYLQDKNSVDKAWWEFFDGYQPADYSPVNSAKKVQPPAQPTVAPLNTQVASAAPTPAAAQVPAAPKVQPDVVAVAAGTDLTEKLKGPAARVVT
ncbi:MAG: hypothetical protein F2839_05645, partial [Actinobacteria bacterium]|nr:hypothetical protein [Actinomycetota bacterium]